MKQEHLIAFGGVWYRIYVRSGALWVDIKENGRFHSETCLMEGAEENFSATETEKYLHCVCSGKDGISYFLFDGSQWHTKKLTEQNNGTEGLNLTLLSKDNFVHLLSVCKRDGETLLVHQLLGTGSSRPAVVDRMVGTDFSVSTKDNGDFTLLYQNGENIFGTKQFRWSEKRFDAFSPLDCGCALQNAVLLVEEDNLHIAAYATFDSFINLLFLTKNAISGDCRLSAVHLLSGEPGELCISKTDGTFTVAWCESGTVLRAHMTENGHWSVPQKFLRVTGRENVLYRLKNGTLCYDVFGYMKHGRILLYTSEELPEIQPSKQQASPSQNIKEHDKPSATIPESSENQMYIKRSVYAADMASLRKLLAGQNDLIVELFKKISVLEQKEHRKSAE